MRSIAISRDGHPAVAISAGIRPVHRGKVFGKVALGAGEEPGQVFNNWSPAIISGVIRFTRSSG